MNEQISLIHVIILIIIILAVIVGCLYFFHQSQGQYEIVGFQWQRWQDVESYRVTYGKSSPGSVPLDAYNRNEVSEKCGSIKVGSVKVPQYCTKVKYNVNRWVVIQTYNTHGKDNHPQSILWPDIDQKITGKTCPDILNQPRINSNTDPLLGCQRPGGKRGEYKVLYQVGNETDYASCNLPYPQFTDSRIGQVFIGYHYTFQHVTLNCKTLELDQGAQS